MTRYRHTACSLDREEHDARTDETPDRPTPAECVTSPPLPKHRGPVPDHKAGWACCNAPYSAHSAADLDAEDRQREQGLR